MNEWMNEWMKMYILVSKTFINENNEWMNEWMKVLLFTQYYCTYWENSLDSLDSLKKNGHEC